MLLQDQRLSRRSFLTTMAIAGGAFACGGDSSAAPSSTEPSRIRINPASPTKTAKLGLQPLGLTPPLPALQRDGMLYVPTSYKATEPLPLVVLLHGASGSGSDWFGSYVQRAESARVIMLAPDSRTYTWDAIGDGEFAGDVAFIESAIASAFDRCAIDANKMALFGFSDGGSYALTLGLANGDTFRHVVACSPGFIVDAPPHGKPDFYMAHGTADPILPIDFTSRRIVPQLRQAGYTVTYNEFSGGHEVPSAVSDGAMAWLTAALR